MKARQWGNTEGLPSPMKVAFDIFMEFYTEWLFKPSPIFIKLTGQKK
jgi:hypothetical protein